MRIDVALVGDRSELVRAHAAIPLALHRFDVTHTWVPTNTIVDGEEMRAFDAVWVVPGSPYRSMDGALAAIRYARENGLPFLGTCGGFQHALIEYARNVCGMSDAAHAE